MPRKQVNRVLKKINELPPFSEIANDAMVAARLGAMGGKEHEGDKGFHDPKFAKQILQMTSFASYGFSGLKAGHFESKSLLDEDVLRGIMLVFSLQEFISRKLSAYELTELDLWEHSINCGLSAWMVATKVGYEDLEAAFIAGMMHDIGKVILDEILYEEKEKYVDIISQGSLMPAEAEREVLGIDHAEVGARIAEKWRFSDKVIEAVRCHHQPELAVKDPDLSAIVHLADCICISLGLTLNSGNLVSLLAGDFAEPQVKESAG